MSAPTHARLLALVLPLLLFACRAPAPADPPADPPAPVVAPAVPPAPAEEYPAWTGPTDKDFLVGIWNGHEDLGSGWSDAWLFWPDGRAELRANQMECDKRLLAEKGFWTLDGTTLVVTVHQEVVAVGGELVDTAGSCASDKELVGAEEKVRDVEPERATRIDLSKVESDPDLGSAIITVEKRRFFKKSGDPGSY